MNDRETKNLEEGLLRHIHDMASRHRMEKTIQMMMNSPREYFEWLKKREEDIASQLFKSLIASVAAFDLDLPIIYAAKMDFEDSIGFGKGRDEGLIVMIKGHSRKEWDLCMEKAQIKIDKFYPKVEEKEKDRKEPVSIEIEDA